MLFEKHLLDCSSRIISVLIYNPGCGPKLMVVGTGAVVNFFESFQENSVDGSSVFRFLIFNI